MTGDSTAPQQPNNILIAQVAPELLLALKTHEKEILTLLHAGVFALTHGQVTINKHEGHIQTVYVNRMTYRHERTTASPVVQ